MDLYGRIHELVSKNQKLEKRNNILKTKIYSLVFDLEGMSTYDEMKNHLEEFITRNKLKP